MNDPFGRDREYTTSGEALRVDIDLVGAGTLGGAILLYLCKMGCGPGNRITVTDFDRCELRNLATQWFRPTDAHYGRPKTRALSEMAAFVCDREVIAVEERFTGAETRRLGLVVILAVDSLAERRRIWHRLRGRKDVRLLVDARMGGDVLEVYAVDLARDAHAAYERSLEAGEEPFDEPCTRRPVLYTALGGAAFVGSLLHAYARGEPFPRRVTFDFRNFLLEVDGEVSGSQR